MHRTPLVPARSLALLAVLGGLFATHAQQDAQVPLPEIDLETREAETPDGTLQARRAQNAFVGEIADGRAIGIAFAADVDIPADENEIIVRLYDRQQATVMVGTIDDRGNALLRSTDGTDFEATVALTMHDDVVNGTVAYGGESPRFFTADAASGDAGVYWALGDEDDEILAADWIVLPGGRQWGVICIPPVTDNPWCLVRGL